MTDINTVDFSDESIWIVVAAASSQSDSSLYQILSTSFQRFCIALEWIDTVPSLPFFQLAQLEAAAYTVVMVFRLYSLVCAGLQIVPVFRFLRSCRPFFYPQRLFYFLIALLAFCFPPYLFSFLFHSELLKTRYLFRVF